MDKKLPLIKNWKEYVINHFISERLKRFEQSLIELNS